MAHVPEELMHQVQTKMRLGEKDQARLVKMAHANNRLHSVLTREIMLDVIEYWEEFGELPEIAKKKLF